MSISIPAHEALGVEAKEYTIVDGSVHNVRVWPGKEGRTRFRMRMDISTGEPETLEEFVLRVPREVACLQARMPKLRAARLTAPGSMRWQPTVLEAGSSLPQDVLPDVPWTSQLAFSTAHARGSCTGRC